jgi:hypothetical protein
VHVSHGYGHDVSIDAYRRRPELVADLLERAGFVVDATLVREPEPREKTPQAYLMASKRPR